MNKTPNIVFVHGAWAEGSCWSAVIRALQEKDYTVTAPQFPETSLAADVARLRQVLRRHSGPTILAGHSNGGQVMTVLPPAPPYPAARVYIPALALHHAASLGAYVGFVPPPT